jgi:hypothetical protein
MVASAELLAAVVRGMRGIRIDETSHASRGGKAYPKEVRELVLQMLHNGGIAAVKTPEVRRLRRQKKFPCLQSCRDWLRQYNALGHVRPMRHTGNRRSEREVSGQALVHLAFYRAIRPHARIYEVKAYLTNRMPQIPPFSDSQISRAEARLGLTRKKASKTSKMAYLTTNLLKRRCYWESAYPVGIADQQTSDMIDLDEARFKLESTDRSYAKVAREFRANVRSKYKKRDPGTNLIMAILGDGNNVYSFHRMYSRGGTDLYRFYCFMRDLIQDLAQVFPNRSFCFTMDNLNIHRHFIILDLIANAGHRIVYRAPYWSCDGAIEYVFNTIHTELEMEDGIAMENVEDLENKINNIVGGLPGFRRYFLNVGFKDN